MADRLNQPSELVHATEDHVAEPPITAAVTIKGAPRTSHGRVRSQHADRFRIAIGMLIGIAIGALAVAGVIIARNSSSNGGLSGQQWSDWAPIDGGIQGAGEIANHLAPFYRLSISDQLDVVTVVDLANPITASQSSSTGGASGLELAVQAGLSQNALALLPGKTIAYELCGVGGNDCSIPGTPSSARLLLLRREALELALYTFKYIGTADNVVAILPPGRTEVTSILRPKPPATTNTGSDSVPVDISMLFDRQELQPWLSQPLSATLQQFPPAASQLPQWSRTQEAGLVDQITARSLFSEKIKQESDGTNLLILSQLPAQ